MVAGLPYDRANTSMAAFPLCPACDAEYRDPRSRRYHAQPTACGACGPQLSMTVGEVVAALAGGRIVALKGVGGYHLACDARDAEAVARLRERKARGDKPFAVMVADLPAAHRIARLDPGAERVLQTPARPVLLCGSRDKGLQACVAPGNSFLGVMLAYTPLHHLLFDAGAPEVLVMTSGNLSDEPICTDAAEAERRLAGIADVFCHHDRVIHVACDDSVVRQVAGVIQPVRRSRGYVPQPVPLPLAVPPMVAVGGEIKAAAAVAHLDRAWLTQHIGDVENLETVDMLQRSVRILSDLQRVAPEVIVSDAHPGYLSRRWAAEFAAQRGAVHRTVQHHHAHLASLLAEHTVPVGEPVLGVVFDGTGFGSDATIWGGEFLLGSYDQVDRVGHLKPIGLPGGDAAVRFPGRIALAHLHAAGLDLDDSAPARAMAAADVRLLKGMLASGAHCTPTTSMGRLFDAVAALLDVRQSVDYEAQAAIELEALADGVGAAPWWSPVAVDDGQVIIDPSGWIASAARAHREAVPVEQSAAAFHLGLAEAVVTAVRAIAERHDLMTVGLTGGVFANAVLTIACAQRLREAGFTVLTHRVVPPNDGGLALGQVCVAAAGLVEGHGP
jgi:hydrogenase maturation protein HypF